MLVLITFLHYALKEKKNDTPKYLNISLENNEIAIDFVEKDDDFMAVLNKHRA